MTEQEIRNVFDSVVSKYKGARWAVCKLDFSVYKDEGYNYAMIIYFPLDILMTLDDYDEERQNQMQMRVFPLAKKIGQDMGAACEKAGVKFHIPPIPVDHQTPPYIIPLSVKEVGVKAGVGWIGKNDLLITYEYGPRICTVGAVFYADWFTVNEPVTKSECGDCNLCVAGCPYRNIYGNDWEEGVSRDDLVDYHKCSVVRYAIGDRNKMGRKLSCARCVLACPVGIENVRNICESK